MVKSELKFMINGMIFRFRLSNFREKNCNLSRNSVLGVFQSHFVRYFRICSDLDGFTERLTNIVDKFVTLGFDSKLLKSRFGTLAIKGGGFTTKILENTISR